jgi:hypothetical protein
MVIPNMQSYYLDVLSSQLKKFGTLSVIAPTTQLQHEFKSIILSSTNKLFVFMTSRRPNVNAKGKLIENKK